MSLYQKPLLSISMCVLSCDIKCSSQSTRNVIMRGLRWKGTTFFLIITISVTTGPDVFSFSIFFFFIIKGKDKLLSKVSSS